MSHLKTLKIVNFVIGAYTFVVGLLFLVMWVIPGWWGWRDGQEGAWLAILLGVLAFLLIGGLGVAHVIVGYLVGSGRGRIAQSLLASMQLMSFPFGTFYALYALYVCWVDEASKKRFDSVIKPKVS